MATDFWFIVTIDFFQIYNHLPTHRLQDIYHFNGKPYKHEFIYTITYFIPLLDLLSSYGNDFHHIGLTRCKSRNWILYSSKSQKEDWILVSTFFIFVLKCLSWPIVKMFI